MSIIVIFPSILARYPQRPDKWLVGTLQIEIDTLPLVSKLSASFSLQTSHTATICFQEYSPSGEIHFQSFSFQGNKKAWVFSIGVYWLCGVLGSFNQLNWGLNGRYRSIPLYLPDKTFRVMLWLQHQKFGAEIHADWASPSQVLDLQHLLWTGGT